MSYVDNYFQQHNIIVNYIPDAELSAGIDALRVIPVKFESYDLSDTEYIAFTLARYKNNWYMGVYYNRTDQDHNSIVWEVYVEESSCQAVYDACREELIDYYGNPVFEPGKASWFSNGTYGIGVLRLSDQCIQIQVCPEGINIGNQ